MNADDIAEKRPPKIFISYTRSDEAFALDLYRALTDADLGVWIDQHGLTKGRPWDQSVERSLSESAVVVVILSPQAVASSAVLDEISYAVDSGKQILPVLLQVCQLPLRINRLDYFDLARGKATMADIVAALREGAPAPTMRGTIIQPPLQRRFPFLLGLLALALALAALAVFMTSSLRSDRVCASTPWQAQSYASPLLAKCGSCQACLDRKTQASLLLSVPDWKSVSWSSSLLGDCMALPRCSERRDQANRLREQVDWRGVAFNDPLLQDCMGYPECEERSRHAALLKSIHTWGRAVVSSLHADCMSYGPCLAASRPTPEHRPPKVPSALPAIDFKRYQCCADAGEKAEECRQWKRINNRIASDCAGL